MYQHYYKNKFCLQAIYYKYVHPWSAINGPGWENNRPVIRTKLCWKEKVVDIFGSKEGTDKSNEIVMNDQIGKDQIQEIKKRMNYLIPDEKLLSLIQGEDMLNLTSDVRKDFTRFIENRENPQALDDEDCLEEEYDDEDIAEEDRNEFEILERKLYGLLPDEDSMKILSRYVQLREESLIKELKKKEQKKHDKNDISIVTMIRDEAVNISQRAEIYDGEARDGEEKALIHIEDEVTVFQ